MQTRLIKQVVTDMYHQPCTILGWVHFENSWRTIGEQLTRNYYGPVVSVKCCGLVTTSEVACNLGISIGSGDFIQLLPFLFAICRRRSVNVCEEYVGVPSKVEISWSCVTGLMHFTVLFASLILTPLTTLISGVTRSIWLLHSNAETQFFL